MFVCLYCATCRGEKSCSIISYYWSVVTPSLSCTISDILPVYVTASYLEKSFLQFPDDSWSYRSRTFSDSYVNISYVVKPFITGDADPPWQFWGGQPIVKYRDGLLCGELCKTAEPIEMPFGIWTREGPKRACITWGAHWRHLENTHWIVHVRQQCGLMSNYFDHLLELAKETR